MKVIGYLSPKQGDFFLYQPSAIQVNNDLEKKNVPKTPWGRLGTVWFPPWCRRPGRKWRSDGADPFGRAPQHQASAVWRRQRRRRPMLAPGLRRPPQHLPRRPPPRRPRYSASCCRPPASTAPATPSAHRRQWRRRRRRWRRRRQLQYHSNDGRSDTTVVHPCSTVKNRSAHNIS